MTLDRWLSEMNDRDVSYERIAEELAEEEENIGNLAQEGKYWEAFNRLNMLFIHLTKQITHDEVSANRYAAFALSSLLDWLARNKSLIDEIVTGIGGEGYGISTSNFGISISVSFGSGTIGTQSSSGGVNNRITF